MSKLRGFIAWVLLLCLSVPASAAILATVFYVSGNGLGTGAVALATVPVVLLLVPRVVAHPSWRVGMALVGLLLCDLAYAGWRVTRVDTGGSLAFCVDGACDQPAPILSRLIREDETAYAGVALSHAMGLLTDDELAVIEPATRSAYEALDRVRGGAPGPNGVLLASAATRTEELIWLPPGEGKVPALVFLHGFGGQITPCVAAFAESAVGRDYAIVAPALDMSGYWWERPGREVLERALATLPPRVDRSRLWLVGLSNGAIGATHFGFDPELGARFRGMILLVGGDAPSVGDVPHGPVLMVAGTGDPRFPIAGLRSVAEAFTAGGADVTLKEVPGDHFILFTATSDVTGAVGEWLAAH